MLVRIETPESAINFHMDITDIDTDGYNIYCSAHAIWGEQGWATLQVSHKDMVISRMLNSSRQDILDRIQHK